MGASVLRAICRLTMILFYSLPARPQPKRNAPSGIAQLRQHSDQTVKPADDTMNLDDFIVPSSMGTPAGISPTPSTTAADIDAASATAGAIPINRRQQQIQDEELNISRASAPTVGPFEQGRAMDEFGYVPRHVRKTSIDERRVSFNQHTWLKYWLIPCSHQRGVRKLHHRCLLLTTTH